MSWEQSRAGQGRAQSGDSCLHADNPWHANTADMQQHSADCQAAQLDTVPYEDDANSHKPGMFSN